MIGFPDIVTFYIVKVKPGRDSAGVSEKIKEALPGMEVYDHETFLRNNIREMQSGFLPFLYTIAVIGVVVLTAILSLLLSVNILGKRKDFALLKTLGSPEIFLYRLIIGQAILISLAGSVIAIAFFFPMATVIEELSPEICMRK